MASSARSSQTQTTAFQPSVLHQVSVGFPQRNSTGAGALPPLQPLCPSARPADSLPLPFRFTAPTSLHLPHSIYRGAESLRGRQPRKGRQPAGGCTALEGYLGQREVWGVRSKLGRVNWWRKERVQRGWKRVSRGSDLSIPARAIVLFGRDPSGSS